MKKKTEPAELTPSEREEMIRLKAENERLRAENAVIKKEIALREEKWAAQLKAKKQRSSKNSVKKDMLHKAFERFPSVNGLIMHSDQGWQYRHAAYRTELQEHKIIQSMSRKGNCYDNCIMETFFGRLKNEMFYGYEKEYTFFEVLSKAISDYIDYYNNRRIQAKTKWMPPIKFREASLM